MLGGSPLAAYSNAKREACKGGVMPRPRKELTDKEFQQLIGMVKIQCTQEEICGVLDMDHETLNARLKERGEEGFSQFYKKHSSEGKMSLRRMQWRSAEEGNTTMLVWLGKQMLGQRDRHETDLKSSDGSMTPAKLDLSKLSTETLAEIVAAKDAAVND